jgi:hypothetical protein
MSSSVALDDQFLGLHPNSIFDTHFVERGRFGRLIGMLYKYNTETNRKIVGIGIDDKTAICIDDMGIGKVYGTGAVSIFQFDDETKIDRDGSNYKIENLKCDILLNDWVFDFNSYSVIDFSESSISVNENKLIAYSSNDIFLTGDSSNDITIFPDLDFFIINADVTKVGVIGDSGNQGHQEPLIEKLNELNIPFNLILIDQDSLDNQSINDRFLESSSFIIKANNNKVPSILTDSSTLLGKTFISKIENQSEFLFLGNNSKLAGDKIVFNTDFNDLASYRGLMKIGPGAGLFKDLMVQPMIFADKDFYENRTSALPYGLMRSRKKIGLYLDFDSRAIIDADKRSISVEGASPLIILDARDTNQFSFCYA